MTGLGITAKDIFKLIYVVVGLTIATTVAVYAKGNLITENEKNIGTLLAEMKEVKLSVNTNTVSTLKNAESVDTLKVMISRIESKALANTVETHRLAQVDSDRDKQLKIFKDDQKYMLEIIKAVATKVDAPIPIREITE